MITHQEKIKAAQYAGALDYDVTARDCGTYEANRRDTTIQLGAWRAFEWLEKNNYQVIKQNKGGENER